MDNATFFTTVFGDASGYMFISSKNEEGKLNIHKAFRYPEQLGQVIEYIDLRRDDDVYWSPFLHSVPRRVATTVSVAPAVYTDGDLFDPTQYYVEPSLVIQTSHDKHHGLWLLDANDYDRDRVSNAARAIALTHAKKINGVQASVDPSGWDLTQLLRVPDTTNTKHTPGYRTSIHGSGEIYTLEDIEAAYDPSKLPAKPSVDQYDLPNGLPKLADVLRRVTSNATITDLYSMPPKNDKSWHERLWLLESEMFRQGFLPEEVFVVAEASACNKYKRGNRVKEGSSEFTQRADPSGDLWKEVLKASVDPNNSPLAQATRKPINIPKYEEDKPADVPTTFRFLTDEERLKLTKTFVDEYVSWCNTKTDAPDDYHVAGAFTILGSVFGEFGWVPAQFGELKLNIWFMIMGDTTRSRKSTSRMLMLKILHMLEVTDTFDYTLTSDITPETLIAALAERKNQSSLYDRDEAQGLFNDIKHKTYLSGFSDTLTELYDGWARGRGRSTGGGTIKITKRTPVNFIMYLMGIKSAIQDELEVKDFQTGFLPRFVFIEGHAKPRTRENDYLKLGRKKATYDQELMNVVMTISNARNHWQKQNPERDPVDIGVSLEAEERWNSFAADLLDYAEKHSRPELVIPTADRLGKSVLKAAGMFAMVDCRDEIELQDVLNAISYGEGWFASAVSMADGVAESTWQRELDKLEKFVIDNGGVVNYATALKWAIAGGKDKRTFIDMVETLVESDVLVYVQQGEGAGAKKSLELAYG